MHYIKTNEAPPPNNDAIYCRKHIKCEKADICNALSCEDFESKVRKNDSHIQEPSLDE